MAAMTSKKPVKVYHVGLKVIAYLNSTAALKLKIAATAEQLGAEQTQFTAEQSGAEQTQFTAEQSGAEQSGGSGLPGHAAGFRIPLAGYCDASFAPCGGKIYGCSMTMLGHIPVTWKAGKNPLVAMSVCEAELLEGSNCALLLESTMAMVQELLPSTLPPKMYIDNQAAGDILNGSSGSWRTRHLRIRHSYVLDKIKHQQLLVEHIPGEDQPADLPTKMHSKARLMHLLGVWGMVGLDGLNAGKVLEGMKLGCLLLVMVAIQSLAAAGETPPEEPVKLKDPLPVTGTSELLMLVVMTCIAAVAVWELVKWAYATLVPMICGTKKSRRLKKLRELARAAAEAEVERWMDDGAQHQSEDIIGSVRRTLRATSSDPGPAVVQERLPEVPLEVERTPSPRGRSPVASRTSAFGGTRPPTPPIPRSPDEGFLERGRVVHDVLALMTIQHLREGLVQEGLPVTGLNEDLINRLVPRRGTADHFPATLPTKRQFRYLLYIWRHRGLSGKDVDPVGYSVVSDDNIGLDRELEGSLILEGGTSRRHVPRRSDDG